MKKIVSLVLTVVLLLGMCIIPAQAKVGDVIGEALHTDIVANINNWAIPSYAVNGTSVIVAEDLRNYGFDVVWDDSTRLLTISDNTHYDSKWNSYTDRQVNYIKFKKVKEEAGTKFADVLESDITVYANGTKITSYCMNGYTFIPIEELTMFGRLEWIYYVRRIFLECPDYLKRSPRNSLEIQSYYPYVINMNYPYTNVPSVEYITGTDPNPNDFSHFNEYKSGSYANVYLDSPIEYKGLTHDQCLLYLNTLLNMGFKATDSKAYTFNKTEHEEYYLSYSANGISTKITIEFSGLLTYKIKILEFNCEQQL